MTKIGLCLIVKNEAKIITRCLGSCKALIDYVYVSDTGSTDDTIQVISKWLEENKIPGLVESSEWKNFAHNRSLALERIRELSVVEYSLMIDADEIIVFNNEDVVNRIHKFKSSLDKDLYEVTTKLAGCIYTRPQLVSTKKKFYYRGAVHEFLDCKDSIDTRGLIDWFYNSPIQDSNRNVSGGKFEKDAQILKQELLGETDDFLKTRYTFYLAQSLKDSSQNRESLKYYQERIKMGGWDEEVYVASLSAARLKFLLKYPIDNVYQSFASCVEIVPHRLESIYELVRLCRTQGKHRQGYIWGSLYQNCQLPKDGLFLEKWIYDYAFFDEYSLCCYYVGDRKTSKKLCERLISENKIPKDQLERIRRNLEYAKK